MRHRPHPVTVLPNVGVRHYHEAKLFDPPENGVGHHAAMLAPHVRACCGARTPQPACLPEKKCCRNGFLRKAIYSTTTMRLPRTSSFGLMPRPGDLEALMRPFTRCGAPSAVLMVT